MLPGQHAKQLKAAANKRPAPVFCAAFTCYPMVIYSSKEGGVESLPLHHLRVKHPLHFIFGKKVATAVAAGIDGGVKYQDPLEYLKVTDIVENGDCGGGALYKRTEICLLTEVTIAVEISLYGTHCCCNGATQGKYGNARPWQLPLKSKPDVGECRGAWDDLVAP